MNFEGTITLQEPITFDKMQEIFGRSAQTELFYATDADGNVVAEFINKFVLDDIRAEITSLRNALEDYGQMDEVHALNFVLQIIDKHMKGEKE